MSNQIIRKSSINLNLFILYYCIIVYTKGLGLFKDYGGLSKGQFNLLSLFQIFLPVLVVVGLIQNNFKIYYKQSRLLTLIIIFVLAIFLSFSIGLAHVLNGQYDFIKYLLNLKSIYIYIFIIYLFSAFKTENCFKKMIDVINILAIIASLITLYQICFVQSAILVGNTIYDKFRYFSATGLLIAFSFFYYYSKVLISKKLAFRHIIALLLLCFGIVIQMHRAVLLGFLLGMFVPIVINKNIKKVLTNSFALTVIILLVGILVFRIFDLQTKYISNLIIGTIKDILSGQGSFFTRWNVFVNTLNDILFNFSIFGKGFVWDSFNFIKYLKFQYTGTITYDNTYTNILLCYGIIGFVIYIGILIEAIMQIRHNLRREMNYYVYFQLSIMIYYITTSFFTDYLFGTTNTIMTIVLFFLLLQYSNNYQNKRNTGKG